MKINRTLTAGALTLFASTSLASTLHGPTRVSEDFSISLEEAFELFTFDDDDTFIAGDRFSLRVEHPFDTSMATIISTGEDDAQDTSVAPIPVPPAVWLFGSGLIGLVVVARRRA